jgi:hypothetical protein
MKLTRDYVENPGGYLYGVGNHSLQNTLRGDYLQGAGSNPWNYATVATRENQFKGLNNPYFDTKLKQGMDELTAAYQQGTAADTNRMFNMGGAFGGSAHQQAIANNEAGLGKALGNFGSTMLNDQFNRSAGLESDDLGRSQQAQQFNKQIGAGTYENERGRQMGAAGMAQNDQGLTLQRYNALMGIGDVNRSLTQDQLNLGYQDWQDERNFDMRQLQNFMGLLSTAQGGIGGNITQTTPGYQASPYSMLMGGLMGYNALKAP